MTPCGFNLYINPDMEIISLSGNVLDLGIYMSGDCTLIIILLVCLKSVLICRDCVTMLTLFKSIVLSQLDYRSQLWSPFLIKHITQLEKIQQG